MYAYGFVPVANILGMFMYMVMMVMMLMLVMQMLPQIISGAVISGATVDITTSVQPYGLEVRIRGESPMAKLYYAIGCTKGYLVVDSVSVNEGSAQMWIDGTKVDTTLMVRCFTAYGVCQGYAEAGVCLDDKCEKRKALKTVPFAVESYTLYGW